ncbi:MAG: hypothetical protein LC672_01210, partial [Acidobacteria bacterium]|nr:hypothetical protein [Acidobacteriota bacterium]
GGGTGYTFEKLRPSGAMVRSTHGVASGPVSFMNIFNTTTDTVKQGGVRRGANMGIMRCLAGDTLIHTLEGRIPIKELVGRQPYVYSCDARSKKVRIARATKVFVSDRNREMVRVWLDNDTYVDATPDHLFMLSNGTYRPAGELRFGDSLMAFSKRLQKHGNAFWKTISCTGGMHDFEHRAVARDILGEVASHDWCNVA